MRKSEAIPDFPEFGDNEDGNNQQPPPEMPPFSAFQRVTSAFCHSKRRRRSRPIAQSSSHQLFYKVYHGYYYSMSSVGVGGALHRNPLLSPQGKSSPISSHIGLLFYLASPTDPTVIQNRSPFLLYTFLGLWKPLHSLRWKITVTRPTTSLGF